MDFDLLNINSEHKPYSLQWNIELLRKKFDYLVSPCVDSNNIGTIVNQSEWLARSLILPKIENISVKQYFSENVCVFLEYLKQTDPEDLSIIKDVHKYVIETETKLKTI